MEPYEIRNALNPLACETIIHEFNNASHVVRSRKEYSFKEVQMISSSNTMIMLQTALIENSMVWLQQFIKDNNITTFPQKYGVENVRVKRYDVGDSFPWHVDVRDYASARRFLVMMYYLNDNFIGGETQFGSEEKIKYTVNPEQGKIVIFSPMWDNPHRGCVVKKGSKYIANVYLHYL